MVVLVRLRELPSKTFQVQTTVVKYLTITWQISPSNCKARDLYGFPDYFFNTLVIQTNFKISKMQLDVGNEPYLSKQKYRANLLMWFFLRVYTAEYFKRNPRCSIFWDIKSIFIKCDRRTDRDAVCTGGLNKLYAGKPEQDIFDTFPLDHGKAEFFRGFHPCRVWKTSRDR